jgi:hypothetical protein
VLSGIALAAQTSDAGQHIITRHGSVRTKGYAPIPEDAFREQFGLLINNDVNVPRVPRNSVSCRKEHRESTSGRYRPHLDDNGKPILRTGFMVDCDTSSDCYSRCGEHPISGVSYVCTPHPRFYSFFVTNSSSSGFYFDEPGDDRFDVTNQSRGVCTDVRYDFQHSGCESMTGSAVVIGLIGCTAKLGWQRAYCGVTVDRIGSDYLQTYISEASLEYPRLLVPASEVNGKVVQEVECVDEQDCVAKCEIFNRISRDGGLPAPMACALCESVCPSNIGTSIADTIDALSSDIATALRVANTCFGDLGFGACLCNLLLLLKPAWMDNLPTPQMQCKGACLETFYFVHLHSHSLRKTFARSQVATSSD